MLVSQRQLNLRRAPRRLRAHRLIDVLEARVLLSAGGTPDPGFGANGMVSGSMAYAQVGNGYLIAHNNGAPDSYLLAPDGSDAGIYTGPAPTNPPPQDVQPDGKYLLVQNDALTRYNPDGSVDRSFGNNGSVTDFTTGTSLYSFKPAAALVQGNQIFVTGVAGTRPVDYEVDYNLGVEKFTPAGTVDHSFGNNGAAVPNAGTHEPYAEVFYSHLGPDGKIYVAGEEFDNPTIARFTTSGQSDGLFAVTDPIQTYQYILGIGFEPYGGSPYGKIVLLTREHSYALDLFRANYDLTPDTTFGSNGHVTVAPPGNQTQGSYVDTINNPTLLMRPDGDIVVSGEFISFNNGQINPDPDKTFAFLPGDPANSGAVSGFIYNDANANGTKDAGETALRYWQAYADLNGNGVFDLGEPTAYADYNGYYKIHGLQPGTYRIYEVLHDGWTRTQPPGAWPGGYHSVTVAANFTSGDNNFGNTQAKSQPGSISGTFFYDYNANGTWDSGESISPYWLVYLDTNNNGVHDSGETEIRADGAGRYTFSNLTPGTYHIRPETASGWTETYPAGGTQIVTVGSGQNMSGINFGEVRGTPAVNGSISGTVFYDSNGNGVRDSGEGVSPYWLVYLDGNNNGVYDSNEPQVRGDANGHYTFTNLAPGSYSVRIRSASGWTQTYPANSGANLVTLGSGQNVSNVNFGEARGTPSTATGSIAGTFFYDSNGNGAWDTNETYSPLWYLYIDANNDGRYDSGDKQIRADSAGRYTFAGLVAGTYVIRAATASGWQQTFPSNGAPHVITLSAGQNVTGVNFGERRI